MKERTQLLFEIKKLGGDQTDLDLLLDVLSDEESSHPKAKHKPNESEIQTDLNQFIKQFDFSQFQHSEYDTTDEDEDEPKIDTKQPKIDTKQPKIDTKQPKIDTKQPKIDTKQQQIERIEETISELSKTKEFPVRNDLEVPITTKTVLFLTKQLLKPQIWYLQSTNQYQINIGENLLFEKAKELYQLEVLNYSKKSSLFNKKIEKHG
jgi:hypothetical protein